MWVVKEGSRGSRLVKIPEVINETNLESAVINESKLDTVLVTPNSPASRTRGRTGTVRCSFCGFDGHLVKSCSSAHRIRDKV